MSLITTTMSPHLVEWYTDIYTHVYGIDSTYTDVLKQFNTYLKQMINGTSFTVFSNILLSIGLVLMLFHFFGDLTEKAAMKQLSMLQMGKSFCLLLAGAFVLFHTKQIFIFMLTMVESLNDTITASDSGILSVSAVLNNETVQLLLSRCVAEHFSIWAIFGYTLTALLIKMVSLGTRVFVMYYAGTRIIQLFVYYVFAPIGVSDIFENGPGGFINFNSSGFKYLKTILAIMMQMIVVTVICQTFPAVATAINVGYFVDQGDTSLQGNPAGGAEVGDSEVANVMKRDQSAMAPLRSFEYTDHQASIREIIVDGVNDIKEKLDALSEMLDDSDDGDDSSVNTDQTEEALKDDEKYKVLRNKDTGDGIIDATGRTVPGQEKTIKEIKKDTNYRMTIESTEKFFDWCTGADGAKMVLFIILMITKVVLIFSSAKICNYIVGTSI